MPWFSCLPLLADGIQIPGNERRDVGGHGRELSRNPATLQEQGQPVAEPKQHRNDADTPGIPTDENDCCQRDPAAPSRHVFGKQAHISKREIRAYQTAAYCTDDERPDTYRRCLDTARTQARSVIACTAQPEPETSPEDDKRGQHSRQESDVDDSIVPAEQPPPKGDSVNQRQLHGWNRPDTGIGEGSLDVKDIAQ